MEMQGEGLFVITKAYIYQMGFASHYGKCTAFRAEMMAVFQGLEMVCAAGITKLLMEMDNQACVQLLRGFSRNGGECTDIINKCRTLSSDPLWEVRFIHVYLK